jgi:hypothetical protein
VTAVPLAAPDCRSQGPSGPDDRVRSKLSEGVGHLSHFLRVERYWLRVAHDRVVARESPSAAVLRVVGITSAPAPLVAAPARPVLTRPSVAAVDGRQLGSDGEAIRSGAGRPRSTGIQCLQTVLLRASVGSTEAPSKHARGSTPTCTLVAIDS